MGQKVNPISVRLEQTNRHFESCWYSDHQYSSLLNEDLKIKSYINNILRQLGCWEGHISMIYMAKKIKILFCYLDGRSSTSLKSSHLYLKVTKNNNKKKENRRKRHFFKNRLAARYLLGFVGKEASNKKIIFSGEKRVSSKYHGTIPGLHDGGLFDACLTSTAKQASHLASSGEDLKIPCVENGSLFDPCVRKTGFFDHSMRQVSRKKGKPFVMKKKDQDFSALVSKKKTPVFASKEFASWREHPRDKISREAALQNIKYKKKYLEIDDTTLPSQSAPYSPLAIRKNPFRLLLAFYKKRKKKKKKGVHNSFSMILNKGRKAEMRRRPLRQRKRVIKLADKGADRQVSFWNYLTKTSMSSLGKEKKNYYPFVKDESLFDPCIENRSLFDPCVGRTSLFDSFSAIWSYLVFNHKVFFNKVIQRKKGFQIWHKSLFIRYLLLFVYKERFQFFASPINYYAATQNGATPMDRQGMQTKGEFSFSQLAANCDVKNTVKKEKTNSIESFSTPINAFSLNIKNSKKMDFSRDTHGIKVGNQDINSTLLKYHVALESINRIEWFQGRGMAFLWFVFNSVHPTQRIFNAGSVMADGHGKVFFSQSKEGLKSLLSALGKRRETLKLYTFPYQITPSQTIIVNDLENGGSFNKTKLGEKRKDGLPISLSLPPWNPWNHASGGVRSKIKEEDEKKKGKTKVVTDPSMPSQKRKQEGLPPRWRPLQPGRPVSKAEGLNLEKKTENYVRQSKKEISFKMARKPLYPRTVKSKGFLSYIEYILSSQLKSSVRLSSWKTKDEKKSALFMVEQIVYFLERRVPFHRIKQQIWRQLKLKSIQGLRITYSGRLGGRSKKAQRSRRKTFQWGQASSHVFQSKISFASKYALTTFGKIGIKVWVCYK